MEQTSNNQKPIQKIYKDRAIWAGTFLGGPLASGYLIAENFKAFNEKDKAKKTWIYAIVATVIIFGGIFLLQDRIEKIPKQIIPIIYTAIAYYIVQHFQGKNIATHINSGGQFYSWWRTITIGITGLIITTIPILGFALISDMATNASLTTNTYGILKHEISFDKNNISEKEIDKIADGFILTTFFDEEVPKYVYAEKVKDNYELSISVVKGTEKDKQSLEPFIQLRDDLQTLFPNNKIIFNLTVDYIDNIVKRLE
jgi:hypothetical protein